MAKTALSSKSIISRDYYSIHNILPFSLDSFLHTILVNHFFFSSSIEIRRIIFYCELIDAQACQIKSIEISVEPLFMNTVCRILIIKTFLLRCKLAALIVKNISFRKWSPTEEFWMNEFPSDVIHVFYY
jgi:hypothetical protein